MSPITRSYQYEDDDDFVDELPWDPLWDYMLGDEERSQRKGWFRGKQQQQQEGGSDADSFLDFLFPNEPKLAVVNSSSNKQSKTATSKKKSTLSSKRGGKGKGNRRNFWRRNKKPDESEWDLASLASSFEFFEDEDTKRKARSTKWWNQQSQSQSPSPTRTRTQDQSRGGATRQVSSSKPSEKSSPTKRREAPKKTKERSDSLEISTSFLEDFANSLIPWGGEDFSSEDSGSEFDVTSSFESSFQTDEPSLLTDDDSSTIASRGDAPSSRRIRDQKRDATNNEVRLRFIPATQGEPTGDLLPPLFMEEGKNAEAFVFVDSEERDEVGQYGLENDTAHAARYGATRDGVEVFDQEIKEGVDMGPHWDVAPVVPAADKARSQANQSIFKQNDRETDEMDGKMNPNDTTLVRSASLDRSIMALPLGGLGKIVCCSIKNASDEQLRWSHQTGLPLHELSSDELATIFPKLRLVSDKHESKYGSAVIGNSNSFEKNLPAHLQLPNKALVLDSGPQSLFEYEYERGRHMNVIFSGFGPLPCTLITVVTYKQPPPSYEKGLISYNEVLVQVEASTVSQTDCFIRRGEWWGNKQISLPNTPGVDFVGKLYRIGKEATRRTGLRKGDRVISLSKWGGNSRYLSVDPDRLVKVPELVDPAEAACLMETYLSAYQLMHFGLSPGSRYRKACLRGRNILILGSMSPNMARAFAQLSTWSGAEMVYATSKPKYFQKLSSLGFVPLSQDPVDWWEKLKGKIDLIISLGEEVTPLHYKLSTRTGEIIIATHSEVDLAPNMDLVREPSTFICSRGKTQRKSHTHFYDVFNEWDINPGKCKKDIALLVRLLEMRTLTPIVIDRIPLGKVARAQELVETKRLSGYLVCEPWLVAKSRAIRL